MRFCSLAKFSHVSREAPVLILKHRDATFNGGGANAVCPVAHLGVNVLPVGAAGDDEAGRLLHQDLSPETYPSQRCAEGWLFARR